MGSYPHFFIIISKCLQKHAEFSRLKNRIRTVLTIQHFAGLLAVFSMLASLRAFLDVVIGRGRVLVQQIRELGVEVRGEEAQGAHHIIVLLEVTFIYLVL